jgi:putative addiction module killer protein
MLGETKLTVREYLTAQGRTPFRYWLAGLDLRVQARVQARVLRFETGNLGDHKSLGGGVWEARLDFGPGYRIYFGKEGVSVILLLLGGEKATQSRDIRLAQRFWVEYKKERKNGKTK